VFTGDLERISQTPWLEAKQFRMFALRQNVGSYFCTSPKGIFLVFHPRLHGFVQPGNADNLE
jgi:hypothetical protein